LRESIEAIAKFGEQHLLIAGGAKVVKVQISQNEKEYDLLPEKYL
jgi:hypothetical protein